MFYLASFFVLVLSSCNIQNHIPQNKALLDENTIEGAPQKHRYQLKQLIQQNPNDKFLGISRLYMWTHLLIQPDSLRPSEEAQWFVGKFWRNTKNKLRNQFGSKPVFVDTNAIEKSMKQMENYLLHNGFPRNNLQYDVTVNRQKAKVRYQINPGQAFTIKEINYLIPDKAIHQLIKEDQNQSLLQRGEQYSSEILEQERERLTNFLKNKGYYNFSKRYINFLVDTTQGDQKVNVSVNIENPGKFQRHKVFKIKNVYLKPYYNLSDSIPLDTLKYEGLHFIARDNKVRPKTLSKKVAIEPGTLYSLENARETYDRLSQFDFFKFVDIRFGSEEEVDSSMSLINCYIELSPANQREINLELEMNTTEQNQQFASSVFTNSRYYGVSPNVNYRNKNFMARGINWDLNLRGGYEFSSNWFNENKENQNIFEFGIDMSFDHQEGLFTRSLFKKRPAPSINTSLDVSYLIEGNPNYNRNTISLGYTYEFDNRLSRVFVKPVSLNYIKTNITRDTFQRIINDVENPFIQSIFDTYTILGSRFGLIYNDKSLPAKNYWNIRWDTEIAGNTSFLLNQLFGGTESEVGNDAAAFQYSFGNVGFYQYVRTRADFIRIFPGKGENEFIARFSPGIGVAFGNTRFLPFEKRFFVGGSNSVRAWAVRDIGPGSYESPEESINARLFQVGDFLLEGNLEYRFDLIYILEGALFTDFGNVWTLRPEENTPGGVIGEDFLSEIAIGSGIGLRYDFTFFVFRTDFGWPVKDPTKTKGSRWTENVSTNWLFNNVRLNIGIGYPF